MKTVVLEVASMEIRAGIENFLMNIIRNLDHDKIQVDFLSGIPGPYDEEIKSYGGRIFRGPSILNRIERIKYIKKILSEHPEIKTVHIHGNTAISCIDARIFKKFGVSNIIIHSHSDGTKGIFSFIKHWICKYYIRKCANYNFSCSKSAGRWMFGSDNFTVISNAINLDTFRFDKSTAFEYKKRLKLENKVVIGHVGRFEVPKNHQFIIKVFKQIHDIHNDSHLLLIGEGALYNEVIKLIKDYELQECTTVIRNSPEINHLLQAMDVFIFPSLWEGLGISLVEAQASGLPCVVSQVIKEEVCVTPLITKMDLKTSVNEWANIVWEQATKIKDRSNDIHIKQLSEAGFNIKETARALENIYLHYENCML